MCSDLDTQWVYTVSQVPLISPVHWSNNAQVCRWVSVIGSLKESQWHKVSAAFSNGAVQDESVSFFDD